jgi:hypothetical protein
MLSSLEEYDFYIYELKNYKFLKNKIEIDILNKSFKFYLDKIIISEKNLDIAENYYNILKVFLYEQNDIYNKTFYKWIYYLEIIYIQINFLNDIFIDKKNDRLKNMNKLIDFISKKAADITINLSEFSNTLAKEIKLANLLLEEYKEILVFDKENLSFVKTKIEEFS